LPCPPDPEEEGDDERGVTGIRKVPGEGVRTL
jgi:hypothetical protein